MRRTLFALVALPALLSPVLAADETLRLELNAAENAQNSCRLSFLVENKGANALESMKVDLAVFNPQGVIIRRLIVELGPVRRAKTIVKTFELEGDCNQIGAILVNDVTACSPGDPASCLDQLALSSRPQSIRLYK